jgi:4-amino-4-deoxy-L-arabinose transferase-like glycosyltransferase
LGARDDPPGDGWSRERIGLAAVLLVALLACLWIWRYRGVDPDEGAHLMDARLLLEGARPYLDFQPRQILYSYLLAGAMRALGTDFAEIRLVAIAAVLATAALVFVVARRLFDERSALVAAAAVALFPPNLVAAPMVHMHAFEMLAASCVAYCLVRHLQDGGWAPLAAAGVLVAVALYIRESGMTLVASSGLTLWACTWRSPGLLLRRLAVLGGAFLVSCAAVILWAGRGFTLSEWWNTPLNPFYIAVKQAQKATRVLGQPGAPATVGGAVEALRQPHQTWAMTRRTVLESARVYSVFGVAMLASAAFLGERGAGSKERDRRRIAAAVLFPWIGMVGLGYGYWSVQRGFFPEYALELLPPLAIGFGFVVSELARRWGRPSALTALAAGIAGIGAAGFGAGLAGATQVPRLAYLILAVLAAGAAGAAAGTKPSAREWRWLLVVAGGIALFALSLRELGAPYAVRRMVKLAGAGLALLGGWQGARASLRGRAGERGTGGPLAYLATIALVAAAGAGMETAGRAERRAPSGVWPQAVVREVAAELRARGAPGDEVVSGAVIWESSAGLVPFSHVTHPLKYQLAVWEDERARLRARMRERPPRFIVLDGYTEQTYALILPELPALIDRDYRLVRVAEGGVYPVRVYELNRARDRADGGGGPSPP